MLYSTSVKSNVLKKIVLKGINKHTMYDTTQYGTSWFVQGTWYCLGSEALKDMMGMLCRLDGEIKKQIQNFAEQTS